MSCHVSETVERGRDYKLGSMGVALLPCNGILRRQRPPRAPKNPKKDKKWEVFSRIMYLQESERETLNSGRKNTYK